MLKLFSYLQRLLVYQGEVNINGTYMYKFQHQEGVGIFLTHLAELYNYHQVAID